MRIKTNMLQQLVKKVSKMGTNKGIGISEYYYILGGEGELSIFATDGNNHIKSTVKESCENISVIVQSETFSKIVEKTTKEYIELQMKEDCLQLQGNGTYKVPIFTGEDYPIPDYEDFKKVEGFVVGIDDLKSIAVVNKSAVSNSPNGGALNGYLITPNGVVTTDERRICFNDRVKSDESILLSKEVVNLISSITDLDVRIYYNNGQVMLESDTTVIVGAELEGKETFPNTQGIYDQFDNKTISCTINKSVVVKALERIGVFINPFDKGEMVLIAEDSQLQFETFEDSYEIVNIPEKLNDNVEVVVNSINLKELLNGLPNEQVKFGFVNDQFITLEQPHVSIILATCEE